MPRVPLPNQYPDLDTADSLEVEDFTFRVSVKSLYISLSFILTSGKKTPESFYIRPKIFDIPALPVFHCLCPRHWWHLAKAIKFSCVYSYYFIQIFKHKKYSHHQGNPCL